MGFTDIFTGESILPSWPAYLSLALTANVLLGWPTEINSGNGYVVAEIIEVNAASAGLSIQLSSALEVGEGYSFLVNNVGGNAVTIIDNGGNTLASIGSGEVWQLYCADNTTANGTWRVFQYGAGVSNANASALAGAGLKAIAATLNNRIFVNAQAVDYTVQSSDRASLVEWTGAGAGTFTLPAPATVGSDWFCYIKNAGGASLTVTPASGTINSAANQTFQVNDSAIVISDGQNYWTIGFGQSLSSSFNFVTISLAGLSGTYTLAGSNLNRISYKFIGALAGNITVVVPASVQQYWIDNETSGAYTMTISSSGSGGATVVLAQSSRNIFYCDGLNVVAAVSGQGVVPTFPDGGASAPSITFTSDTTLGFYKAGTDTLGIASAGVLRGSVNATGNWVLTSATSGTTFSLTGGLSTDSLAASSNATIGGTLGVTGNAALSGTLSVTGAVTGGTYNGQTISSSANFTGTLSVAAASTFGTSVTINGPAGVSSTNSLSVQAGNQYIDFVPNVPAGSYNGIVQLNDSIIYADGNASPVLTLTTHSTSAGGIRINGSSISMSENITLVQPGGGTALTINSAAADNGGINLLDNNAPGAGATVFYIRRNGTVANTAQNGPNILLEDLSNNQSSLIQHSGGQTEFWQSSGGWTQAAYFGTDNNLHIRDDGGNMQVAGFRGVPFNNNTSNYTLQLSDRGKMVTASAGNTITIPAGVFSQGDVVTFIFGAASGTVTIAPGSGLTLQWANGSTTSSTGNRTMSGWGIATVVFPNTNTAWITGSGLS